MLLGGKLFVTSEISQGDIQAILSYFTQIQLAVTASTILAVLFTKAFASSSRINEVFDLKSSLKYGEIKEFNYQNDTIISFKMMRLILIMLLLSITRTRIPP